MMFEREERVLEFRKGWYKMIKLLGPGNDLYTETGEITKTGYLVMAVSSAFGLLCFFMGRSIYGKLLQRRKAQ